MPFTYLLPIIVSNILEIIQGNTYELQSRVWISMVWVMLLKIRKGRRYRISRSLMIREISDGKVPFEE